ncbi:PucR family transcriptional regulator [Mycobacterium sp. CBMA271]|uniref:PucR family transcriptional regulator n=1 Tax=unclassified Mycobacteroides TaxID=2618759 RepID=UPI0012DFD07E|nr:MULTISPECIES: PucR family transcriptional regulator [unclassified Mycobacteroides]MUM19025.1 hypothetical protein [Mycobacteroides sp. CBMA 326]MUM24681.1 PucR family transcriptional regulator [Mycobacteroides sp. CBMA 271]
MQSIPSNQAQVAQRNLLTNLISRTQSFVPQLIARMRADIPNYARLDVALLLPDATLTLDRLLQVVAEGREFTQTELAVLTAHGEARGRQDVPVTDMFSAWRIAIRTIADELISSGRERNVPDHVLLDTITELLQTSDAAIHAIASGHHQVEVERARHAQEHRADLVRAILLGTLGPAEIRFRADHYGLDTGREYRAIRARPTAAAPADRLIRLFEGAHSSDRPRSLIALVDGDVAGIMDDPPTGTIDAAIGIGPSARLDQMERSFRHATRAMATAEAFGLTGIHDLADLGLLPAVLADAEIGDELVRRYVTPLGDGAAAAVVLDTVHHYFINNRRVDHTAEAMHVHTNTIRYRIHRFEELLGVDLDNADTALETWWALQRIRLSKPVAPFPIT